MTVVDLVGDEAAQQGAGIADEAIEIGAGRGEFEAQIVEMGVVAEEEIDLEPQADAFAAGEAQIALLQRPVHRGGGWIGKWGE